MILPKKLDQRMLAINAVLSKVLPCRRNVHLIGARRATCQTRTANRQPTILTAKNLHSVRFSDQGSLRVRSSLGRLTHNFQRTVG